MQRTRTAERDEREPARVDPAFDAHSANCALHRRVDDGDDSRRVNPRMRERVARGGDLEPAQTGERGAVVDAAQYEVRVGHRRRSAPASVARGSGVGARALGSDHERATGIEPGDGTSARADRVDVERGQPDREPTDSERGRGLGDAAAHQADVGAGAAHVEGDRVRVAARGRDRGAGAHATGRSRQQQARGHARGVTNADEPAGRRHHEHLCGHARDAFEIRTAYGPQVRVDNGGDHAFVLAELG